MINIIAVPMNTVGHRTEEKAESCQFTAEIIEFEKGFGRVSELVYKNLIYFWIEFYKVGNARFTFTTTYHLPFSVNRC